jgi:hypothetical protein
VRLSVGYEYSVTYIVQIGGCLQSLSELCQLLEADCPLSVGVYSVSYKREIGGCLLCISELCHLSKADWRLSAGSVHCQLREECWWLFAGCVCTPSDTLDRLTVVFNGV